MDGLWFSTSWRNCATMSNTSGLLCAGILVLESVVKWPPMSLIRTIQTDTTNALKSGDKVKLNTLRLIVSQLKYKEIELKRDITDEEAIAIIRKQVKELMEDADQFKTGGRQDLYDENMQQIKTIQSYLPIEISDDELSSMVQKFIDENKDSYTTNPRAFTGRVVGALKSKASPDRIVQMYNKIAQ